MKNVQGVPPSGACAPPGVGPLRGSLRSVLRTAPFGRALQAPHAPRASRTSVPQASSLAIFPQNLRFAVGGPQTALSPSEDGA